MKYFTFIPALLLSLTSVNAFADDFTCQQISGTISKLVPDPECKILQSKPGHFPDVTFVAENFPGAPNICFSSQLATTLGGKKVIGKAYSGITVNGIGELTAASAIQFILKPNNVELGWMYTKDVIGNAVEILAMADGTRTFNDGRGGLEITGNALEEATSFTGKLCMED